ncbi:HEAT repeat domain-containing protein [Pseudomonadota bacterium]
MISTSSYMRSEPRGVDLKQHLMAMRHSDNPDMDELISCLRRHPVADIRATAAALLGELPATQAGMEALGQGLLDEHYFVREMSAQSLKEHAEDAYIVIPALIKALKRNTDVVKLDVLKIVQAQGVAASPAIPLLTSLLTDRSQEIAQAAAYALAAMKEHASIALPILRQMPNQSRDRVRTAAQFAIANIIPTSGGVEKQSQLHSDLIEGSESGGSNRWMHY